jgi:hypothetical protein
MAEKAAPEQFDELPNVMKQAVEKKPETIESLLKFLIYLVLHKEEVSVDERGDEAKVFETRISLLELLKQDN